MFGYNIQNWSQENGIGAELVPGATNRLLYAQPTYSQSRPERSRSSRPSVSCGSKRHTT